VRREESVRARGEPSLIPDPKWFLRIAYVGVVVLGLLLTPGFLPRRGADEPGGFKLLTDGEEGGESASSTGVTASGRKGGGAAAAGVTAGTQAAALAALEAASASSGARTGRRVGPKPTPTTLPPDPRVVHVPASIDSRGGREVTNELNGFLRSVPDHRTIVFPAGGRYRVDGTLVLQNRNDLIIEGRGAVVFSDNTGANAPIVGTGPDDGLAGFRNHWPRHRSHWVVVGSNAIILRNIVVRGAHPNAGAHDYSYKPELEAQHGVDFARGTRNSVLENCRITDVYGDFVYNGSGVENIVVRNCHFERSGRQGLTVTDGNNITFQNNFVTQVGRTAFDLEPNTASDRVTNVRILDNRVGPANGLFVGSKGAGDVSHISIVGNSLLDGEPMGVVAQTANGIRRHDWYVGNNVAVDSVGSPHGAIRFAGMDRITVTGNTVPLNDKRNPPQQATQYVDCTGIVEHSNNFYYV
jgi:hypothetical protein